jgi:hypothetical protein
MTASRAQPSNPRIAGVALLLFSGILLGVGIHHLIATGTCSSTGYSADYGPVPFCRSGTGYWFAFVFGGIFGSLIGAAMAASLGLVFAGIFGAIGIGSLTLVMDHIHGGELIFAVVFGGGFALVGLIGMLAVTASALGSLRTARAHRLGRPPANRGGRRQPRRGGASRSRASSRHVSSAPGFGDGQAPPAAATAAPPVNAPPAATSRAPTLADLLPGLEAARHAAVTGSVDDLSKLADLHRQGELTDAEFAAAKARLLEHM